ncbi:hypothetical protein GCM10010399_20420 [Dactylosporangium fulvum]
MGFGSLDAGPDAELQDEAGDRREQGPVAGAECRAEHQDQVPGRMPGQVPGRMPGQVPGCRARVPGQGRVRNTKRKMRDAALTPA